MILLDATLLYLLPLLLVPPTLQASEVLARHGGHWTLPSAGALAACPKSCGNLTIDYPFGIGSGCFRRSDFELTCDHTARPPKLFLSDGTTQVVENAFKINTAGEAYNNYNYQILRVAFSHIIPMRSGVDVYNMSWNPPGTSFTIVWNSVLNITGCDFDLFLVDQDTGTAMQMCTVSCPNEGIITEAMARENCNGTGCCLLVIKNYVAAIHLKFVRRSTGSLSSRTSNQSSIWDRINIATNTTYLMWSIVDQSSCASTVENTTNYACVSSDSRCVDSYLSSHYGYFCRCNGGYRGNPYVLHGCLRDKGYNPVQHRANCTRQCGNISIPFPFGLEEGCFARNLFYLNCTASSILLLDNNVQVTDIDVDEGLIKYTERQKQQGSIYYVSEGDSLYVDAGESAYLQWAVANLTCPEAQYNISGYACVSTNSTCVPVNSTDYHVGYRCKCSIGFQGNPYIQNGCQDIDECRQPNICQGICHNVIGSHYCTECPHSTEYDPVKMQCTRTKQQNILLGIIIGLSTGVGILLLVLCGVYLVCTCKRSRKRLLQRKHFRRNQGLLLEQLISANENASDMAKIFSLEELENATNNFDPKRILGHGGHGMVFKGILSDQHVVAIKRSKFIEESEINQFINEVVIHSQINHRNIVKLFGCCLETVVPLLVYDFVPNGSLFEILQADSSIGFSLSWNDCLRIATEAAGALYYLHSAASISVFHRDVKSSNILLDGTYTAKISDFGSSRLVPIDQSHVVTNVQGTFGYLDPEYYYTGQLNEKSDVYSFGVVLIELLLRKEPVVTDESGLQQNLSNYFLEELKERPIKDIVAAQVLEEATEEEINNVASLAEMCLRLQGEKRPTMKQVEMTLQFLRMKRLNPCHDASINGEDIQSSTCTATRAKANFQSLAIDMGDEANLAFQPTKPKVL